MQVRNGGGGTRPAPSGKGCLGTHNWNTRVARGMVQGGIGYQVSDITSTKCSFGYFSLDTPTPFAVLTVFLDNT